MRRFFIPLLTVASLLLAGSVYALVFVPGNALGNTVGAVICTTVAVIAILDLRRLSRSTPDQTIGEGEGDA